MTPDAVDPGQAPANYPTPVADAGADEEIEHQLALAWASLAAERDAFTRIRRVFVLRPFAL